MPEPPRHVTTLSRFAELRRLSLFGLDDLRPDRVASVMPARDSRRCAHSMDCQVSTAHARAWRSVSQLIRRVITGTSGGARNAAGVLTAQAEAVERMQGKALMASLPTSLEVLHLGDLNFFRVLALPN